MMMASLAAGKKATAGERLLAMGFAVRNEDGQIFIDTRSSTLHPSVRAAGTTRHRAVGSAADCRCKVPSAGMT